MPDVSEPANDLKEVQAAAGPYPIEAIGFVQAGLAHTASLVHANRAAMTPEDHHVSGQQLCLGLLDFALSRYGVAAPMVMERWNIRRTDDFGRIVYALIDAGLMNKNPSDRIEHFQGVFDFAEVFSTDAMRRQLLKRVPAREQS